MRFPIALDQIQTIVIAARSSSPYNLEDMIRCFALVLSVVSITLAVPLQVDLGYSIYQGVANSTTGLTTFKGCADPPLHEIVKG
jgi:hypothetical protein